MGRRKKEVNMVATSIHIPSELSNMIESLVKRGYYNNKSEFIRFAIIEKLRKDLEMIDKYKKIISNPTI